MLKKLDYNKQVSGHNTITLWCMCCVDCYIRIIQSLLNEIIILYHHVLYYTCRPWKIGEEALMELVVRMSIA